MYFNLLSIIPTKKFPYTRNYVLHIKVCSKIYFYLVLSKVAFCLYVIFKALYKKITNIMNSQLKLKRFSNMYLLTVSFTLFYVVCFTDHFFPIWNCLGYKLDMEIPCPQGNELLNLWANNLGKQILKLPLQIYTVFFFFIS